MSKASSNSASASSYFEQQRAMLVQDIGQSMEQVLQAINKLNRNLEGIVAVGGEFSSVEALWSNFENLMGKPANAQQEDPAAEGEEEATTVVG